MFEYGICLEDQYVCVHLKKLCKNNLDLNEQFPLKKLKSKC